MGVDSLENIVSRHEAKLKFIKSEHEQKEELVRKHAAEFKRLKNLDKREDEVLELQTEVKTKDRLLDKLISDFRSRIEIIELTRSQSIRGIAKLVDDEVNIKKRELFLEVKEKNLDLREKMLNI